MTPDELDDAARPLDGVKVLDFTTLAAGPAATRVLADYGATVVKLESARRLDNFRLHPPHKEGRPGANRSYYFAVVNAGKLSFGINMKRQPQASSFIRKYLIAWADVVVESWPPGLMERWGLSYEALSGVKPDIIMARCSLAGHSGPLRELKGFGNAASALAGIYDVTGWPDRPPTGPFGAYSDFIAAHFLLIGVLAALDHKERTGEGQCLVTSLLESTVQFTGPMLMDYMANGKVQERAGNQDRDASPHGVYPCKGEEQWCTIAVTNDEEWRALGRVLNEPWTMDPRFDDAEGRRRHREEVDRLLGRWTASRSTDEVVERLQGAGVAAGKVLKPPDLFQDPQLSHRHHFATLHHPELGEHAVHTSSFRLSGSSEVPQRPAPLLGEHTMYVCEDLLKVPEEELTELLASGVLEIGDTEHTS